MQYVDFAESENQMAVASLLDKGLSKTQISKELGIAERNVYRAVQRLKGNAVKRGYSPEHDMRHVVPAGYKVKGVST